MTKDDFLRCFENKTLILDGATATNLRCAGMPNGACAEKWILDHPDVLQKLQAAYKNAGSQVICTPTVMTNRISLAKHGLAAEVETLNKRLVELSREAVGEDILLAGDLTTTGQLLEPLGSLSYEELLENYREQITYLAEAGVDLLFAETMVTVEETAAILDAAGSVCDLPVMCALTISADGSLFFGGNIFDAAEELEDMGAVAVGCNCSVGPDQLLSVIRNIKVRVNSPVIAKPNAGIPTINNKGEAIYGMDAVTFGCSMKSLAEAGATILGGCCGTTPEYIQELVRNIGD